jgi:hypothetical protein
VRGLVHAFGRRLVAVAWKWDPTFFARPLNGALLWRQGVKAAKSGEESPHSKSFLFVRELAKFFAACKSFSG